VPGGGEKAVSDADRLARKSTMRALILAAAALTFAAPAMAEEFIRCTAAERGKHDVQLAIDAAVMLGQTVSCIDGDFVSDVACAPDGAYGLSDPQPTRLSRIVTTVWDYQAHHGAVTGYAISPRYIHFTFRYMIAKPPLRWSFLLDRRTGKAVLKLEPDGFFDEAMLLDLKDHKDESFRCRPSKRKF
jgi:hypothetical protein